MHDKRHYTDLLERSLGDRITIREGGVPNEVQLSLRSDSMSALPELCSLFSKSLKAHFTTLVANDERSLNGTFALYYVFSVPTDDLFLILHVPVDPRHMEVPSVTSVLESVSWFEREVKDQFGIIAFPNIYKLASHPDWPEDVHPMVKDFDLRTDVPRVRGRFDFKRVEGEGVFEIPVGPVHAGIIEPGHFRFSVAGEPIINLDVQLFYTHKGTEKIAEGMPPQRAVFLAERISGDTSFGHALAFCHGIERMSGCEIPVRASVCRTILLELERIANHVGDIGSILLDSGFSVGAARAFEIKESVLSLNEILTGSRLLRGMAFVGGLRRDPQDTPVKRETLRKRLMEVTRTFEAVLGLIQSSSSVMDRLETTGRLSQTDAYRLGVTGMAGRASGLAHDYRQDHPHDAYASVRFHLATRKEGDVLARTQVRIDEVRTSLAMVAQLQNLLSEGPVRGEVRPIPPRCQALGYVEGWRGELVHWIMSDDEGNMYRWKITDPSFRNWRGLTVAVRNNIVPDFPLINKSFNLSYSGNDR